jgi:hypothetical protein
MTQSVVQGLAHSMGPAVSTTAFLRLRRKKFTRRVKFGPLPRRFPLKIAVFSEMAQIQACPAGV